jgi:hypothetical protein
MPLRAACPAGHKLIVPDDRAGRTLRCPRCGAAVVVPGERVQEQRVQGSGFRVQEETRQTNEAVVAVKEQELPRAQAPKPEPPKTELRVATPISRPRPPASPVAPRAAPPVAVPRELPVASPEPPPELLEAVVVTQRATPLVTAVAEARQVEPGEAPAPLVAAPLPAPPEPTVIEPSPPVALPALVQPLAEPEAKTPDDVPPPTVAEPELLAEPSPAPPAARPDPHRLPAVYALAAALVAAALFGIAPAVWDVVDYVQYYDLVESPQVARWALILLLLGCVQVAYAVYLWQLPDWASMWVVTLYALALAGLYALMLGLVLISGEDGLLVGPHGLQLADKLAGGQAALWCLAMTSVSTILAFFAGRVSVQWRRAESLLRPLR